MNDTSAATALLGLDCTDILDRYDAVRRQAREAYDAVERPAWEAYDAAERPAWEAYDAVERPAREAYDAVERQAREAYDAELLELDDPLVTWIVRNAITDHRNEAVGVPRLLPCTLDDLDRHARANDWCSAWTSLRESAVGDLGLATA